MKTALIIASVLAIAAGAWWLLRPTAPDGGAGSRNNASVSEAGFVSPDLAGEAVVGERIFEAKCSGCHGEKALGTNQGPPFLHPVYLPGHHGDAAFLLAAQQGVRAHHWQFGNMPPVEGVTTADVKAVVAYVRALQRANGMID